MRQNFFIILLIVVAIGGVLFFLWQVGVALYGMFVDWRSQRQLDQMAEEHADRRRRVRESNRQRLQSGCDHDYEDLTGEFPAGVCVKCGLARERPPGDCDHIWQRTPGPIPGSTCTKCGKPHGAGAAEAEV